MKDIGRKTKYITKIFRRTDLKAAYEPRNTSKRSLNPIPVIQDKYLRSGIYQLQCPDCNKKCMGQTARQFHQKYKEYYQDFLNRKQWVELLKTSH